MDPWMSRNDYYSQYGTHTDREDDLYESGIRPSEGWRMNRAYNPSGLVARSAGYVPFQSLCWRDGSYGYNPDNVQYPQMIIAPRHNYTRGTYSDFLSHDTPSAPNFPVNTIIELQMRDQPDYGGMETAFAQNDPYDTYGNGYGSYGYETNDFGGYDYGLYGYGADLGYGGNWGNYGWW